MDKHPLRGHSAALPGVLFLSLVALQGCNYCRYRIDDALEMFDIGFTFTATPQFSAYMNCPVILPVGYGKVEGDFVGVGGGKAGLMKHQQESAGLLFWGRERVTWNNFDTKEADTLSVQDVGVMGLALGEERTEPYKPACMHYLHIGWIGVVGNIRWLEIPDFLLGIVCLDPLQDDGPDGGWWFWRKKAAREKKNDVAGAETRIAAAPSREPVPGRPAALNASGASPAKPALGAIYPGLTNGCFATATLGELPEGVLMQFGKETITKDMLDQLLAEAPQHMKAQLGKNALFLLQEMATRKLLLQAASEAALKKGIDLKDKSEAQRVSDHLQELVADVQVNDAEIAEFYAQNQDTFGGAKLAEVKNTLREYLRKTKRQEAVDRYVRGLGGAHGVVIREDWGKVQAERAMDNPVDKAKRSGKPTLVDFGATGCRPCEMMAPILQLLQKKYAGKANVVFVHTGEEPILAVRYGIREIPVQVFFDATGRELFRHSGFFSQEDIEKKFAEMGVK